MAQPQPGEQLTLYQWKTQRLGTARVVESYFSGKAATGRVSVESVILGNPVADPSLWQHLLPGRGPEKPERQGID